MEYRPTSPSAAAPSSRLLCWLMACASTTRRPPTSTSIFLCHLRHSAGSTSCTAQDQRCMARMKFRELVDVAIGPDRYPVSRKRPSFRRGRILRRLPLLGTYQGLVRLARPALRFQDGSRRRLPPPLRHLCPVSRQSCLLQKPAH